MASLSAQYPSSGTSSSTLSSLPKSSHFFTKKPSQLIPKNPNFRAITSQAKRNHDHDQEQNASRRNLLIGLGGLYGALSNAPFVFAAPIAGPDISKCGPADLPGNALATNCCPPVPSSIVDFRLPAVSTVRLRPAAHLANQAYYEKYKRAIQLMKALPDSDPRSFKQQANVHCAYCNGALDQVGFPNVEFQVHGSWLFMPFHRLYLYFFERICGKLLDDPTFAMPFWNWDAPGGMSMPAAYADRSSALYDTFRDSAHQPPYIIDLDFNGDDSNLPNSQQVSQNLTIMYRQMVSNSRTSRLFFGGAYRAGGTPGGGGSIENIPHGAVHVWSGDRDQPNVENMGNFYSAARDPLFYAHHSNIDRLWSVWKSPLLGSTGSSRRQDITDTDWLNTSFLFYDENAQMVRVRVRDCLDSTKLGYQYQDVEVPWLNSRPTPRVSTAARQLRRMTSANAAPEDHSPPRFPLKLNKPVRVMVKRPSKKKRSKAEKEEKDEILVVQKIAVGKDTFAKFDVFINDEDDPKSTPQNTEFAGSFVRVPHGHEHGKNDGGGKGKKKVIKTDLTLSLTDILEDMDVEDDDHVLVTLVPRAGCGDVTIGGIKIELD